MAIRWRTLAVTAAAVAGLTLTGGVTTAAASGWGRTEAPDHSAMNFYQFQGHYAIHDECVAAAQEFLWPTNPGGADDYECRAQGGGWDLYLIFAT